MKVNGMTKDEYVEFRMEVYGETRAVATGHYEKMTSSSKISDDEKFEQIRNAYLY